MSDCTWLEMQPQTESVSQELARPKGLVEQGGDPGLESKQKIVLGNNRDDCKLRLRG